MESEKLGLGEELERYKRLNAIYWAIISRYKDYISNDESISVAELPRLVTPKNPEIVKKAKEILSGFDPFDFDKNFYDASVLAYDFVKNNITSIVLPIEFWLEPSETLEFGTGEEIDRYTLLCSMLVAMGNPSSKILIVVKNEKVKATLYYELAGSVYLMDFNTGITKLESRESLLERYNIDDDTTAYEFNDKMYLDIS